MNSEYPEGGGCYIPRLERTMRDIPDKYHEFLWEYTGSGKSPASVQAAVSYIESSATIDETCETFGVSDPALRDAVNAMIDNNVVTLQEVRENCVDNGLQTFGEKRLEGQKSANLQDT